MEKLTKEELLRIVNACPSALAALVAHRNPSGLFLHKTQDDVLARLAQLVADMDDEQFTRWALAFALIPDDLLREIARLKP